MVKTKVEKRTVQGLLLLISLILIGVTLSFLQPQWDVITPKLLPLVVLFSAFAIVVETGLAKALKVKSVLTAHKVGAYLVAVFVISLAIIGIAGLLNTSVPDVLAPYAGVVTGIGALLTLGLMYTDDSL